LLGKAPLTLYRCKSVPSVLAAARMHEGELKKQREIASALKAKGIDAGMIATCTGLSLDEVAKL
jgi:hypothetical protein